MRSKYASIVLTLWSATVSFLIMVALFVSFDGWSPLTIALPLVTFGILCRRAFQVSLAVTDSGVEVVNFTRRSRVPFEDLLGMEDADVLPGERGIALVHSGGRTALTASAQVSPWKRSAFLADLVGQLERHGFTSDGGPTRYSDDSSLRRAVNHPVLVAGAAASFGAFVGWVLTVEPLLIAISVAFGALGVYLWLQRLQARLEKTEQN